MDKVTDQSLKSVEKCDKKQKDVGIKKKIASARYIDNKT